MITLTPYTICYQCHGLDHDVILITYVSTGWIPFPKYKSNITAAKTRDHNLNVWMNKATLEAVMSSNHFYSYHSIGKDVTSLLAKIYNFGKYVRLTVCYLPKFSILASMFVWRFVCLSVCLFVGLSYDTGRNVQAIKTKLSTYMYLGSG